MPTLSVGWTLICSHILLSPQRVPVLGSHNLNISKLHGRMGQLLLPSPLRWDTFQKLCFSLFFKEACFPKQDAYLVVLIKEYCGQVSWGNAGSIKFLYWQSPQNFNRLTCTVNLRGKNSTCRFAHSHKLSSQCASPCRVPCSTPWGTLP